MVVSAKEILIGHKVATPPEARPLDDTLAKYSRKGGRSLARV
jgi:hypothetical protein